MTAYTITGASATANVATDFTPNGIPVYPDTLTIGANKTLVIPVGYTFDATVTAGGSSQSARANVTLSGVGSVWQAKADQTMNSWNNIVMGAGSVLDGTGNFGWRFTAASSANVPNQLVINGTEANPVIFTRSDYVSGEPTALLSTATVANAATGLFDAKYLAMENMVSVRYGGGSNAGNHFRAENIVLDDAGLWTSSTSSHLSNDWILKKIDYRHSHVADVSGSYLIYLGGETSAGTPTGTKVFDGFTAKHNDPTSNKLIRFYRPDYVYEWKNVVLDSVLLDRVNNISIPKINSNWSFRYGEKTSGCLFLNDTVKDSIFIMDGLHNAAKGNYHLFDNRAVSTLNNCFMEGLVHPSYNGDAGDWWFIPLSGNCSVTNNILIDDRGGVFISNLGADFSGLQPSSANLTDYHNTCIAKRASATAANPYGTHIRTETNGYFTGTVDIKSNLNVVLDNVSSDGKIAAMLLVSVTGLGSTVPSDQIDIMDYNGYWNFVPSPPTNLFKNVNSTTKTYGDDGYGMHDYLADNPMLSNYPARSDKSVILAFAETKGMTSTAEIFDELMKLNGFNPTTRRQSSAVVPAFIRADITAYAQNCVMPMNTVFATGAHDGGTVGAVQYVDSTPDAFDFGTITGASLSTVTVGTTDVTVAGVTAGVDISAVASGGLSYRVSTDGGSTYGSWTTATTNVRLGYVIQARVTSSASYSTLVTGTLTIGGVAGTLQVTTRAIDTTPDAFTFGSVTGVNPSTVTVGSSQAVVSGVDAGEDIAAVATGGLSYRVSTDGGSTFGSWTTSTTNVQKDYVIEARVTSSSSFSTLVTGTLTLGSTAGTLQVTTRAADTTPTAFSFTAVTGADVSTVTVSPNQVTVAGVDPSVNISAVPSGGLSYRVSTDGGSTFGSWLTGTSNVQKDYVIEARITSSASYSTLVTGTLTIGGVAGTFPCNHQSRCAGS